MVQMAPQHRPERKHGLGLVEEKEPPFIYGHVWVWDTITERQIEEVRDKRKRVGVKLTRG